MTKCLIVDDSLTVRRVIRQILSPFRFDVIEAQDGQKALEMTLDDMPDLILLDWNMPIMDGLSFLRRFRALPHSQSCKVIFCTTMNDIPQIEEALDAGADEYIMKPFDESIMLSKLSQIGLVA